MKIIHSSGRRLLAALMAIPLLFWILSGLNLNWSFREILANADQAAAHDRRAINSLSGQPAPVSRPLSPHEEL